MPLPKELPEVQQGSRDRDGRRRLSSGGDGGGAGRVVANRYQLDKKLGSGAFGTAFLVADLKSNRDDKVLKQIGVADLQPDETVDAVREARLLSKLDHPYIVKFHDSFMDGDHFCIVTEFCEGGDLDAKLVQQREVGNKFEESLVVDWFIQITTAVRYIHERRILHRDLKARNIFLKNNLMKLGDFGISRILMGTSDLATTFTGTPYYMSPEVLKHDGYNSKSDIWSLGCILFELCTLQHAFQGQNIMAVMYKIVEGETPRLPDHFNPQLRQLLLRMLEREPKMRPSAVEILQEPFIQLSLQKLHGKLSSRSQLSSHSLAQEADAIAKALTPVKKKALVQEQEEALTPKEKMALRKKQRADMEAEKLKQEISQNYKEGRYRFKQHQKKQQTKVVPPWVEEHPDVFSDPEFSVSRLDTRTDSSGLSFLTEGSMDMSFVDGVERAKYFGAPVKRQEAWDTDGVELLGNPVRSIIKEEVGRERRKLEMGGVGGGSTDYQKEANSSKDNGRVSEGMSDISMGNGGAAWQKSPCHWHASSQEEEGRQHDMVDKGMEEEEDYIPEDPLLAETHYSKYEDFESVSSENEDDMDALMECIEDALGLSNPNIASLAVVVDELPSHDEISPFSPMARDIKITNLSRQCITIYGEAVFKQLHSYIHTARYQTDGVPDENAIMAGLKAITSNMRDCFLVDQLVFLEKQAEAVAS